MNSMAEISHGWNTEETRIKTKKPVGGSVCSKIVGVTLRVTNTTREA